MFVSSWSALLAQTSPSAKQYQLPIQVYHTTTKIDLPPISGNWVRSTPLPALCNTGFYQALCWRGQCIQKVHLNLHSKCFLFHMEQLRASIVHIIARTVAAKGFKLSPESTWATFVCHYPAIQSGEGLSSVHSYNQPAGSAGVRGTKKSYCSRK